MNMFLHELRQYSKSTIIWIVSVITVATLYMALYPSMKPQVKALQKILENYPQVLKQAIGIGPAAFATFAGFYALIMTFTMLATSIQAMNIGTSIVAKEEHSHTAEFLLAKPVRRTQILSAKLMAGLTIILITNAFFIVSMWFAIDFVAEASMAGKTFILITLTIFFVQLFFLALGFLVSVTALKIRSVLSISLTTVFVFYVIGILDSVIGSKTVRYLTPFKFFDYQYITKNRSYELSYLIVEVIFIVIAIPAAYYFYLRRDIT
jgi:ABC-2 type transport system permease protein